MKILSQLFALMLLIGCGTNEYTRMSEDVRQAMSPEDLRNAELYVAIRMEFVSLQKGEIIGEDLFKYEKKKTLQVLPETPGRVIAAGPGWLNVEFNDGIILVFRFDPSAESYQTPGWGTVTIRGERFDVKQGILAGKYVDLLIRSPRL